MAFFFPPDRQLDTLDDRRSVFAIDGLPEEILVPITSGAFVRGIAETFELLAVPAVFLDRGGHVLFANRAADAALTGTLRVRANHLVADRREDNRVVSALMAQAMGGVAGGMRSALLPSGRIALHILPIGDHLASLGQMLSAIALIDDGGDPWVATVIKRIGDMASDATAPSANP